MNMSRRFANTKRTFSKDILFPRLGTSSPLNESQNKESPMTPAIDGSALLLVRLMFWRKEI